MVGSGTINLHRAITYSGDALSKKMASHTSAVTLANVKWHSLQNTATKLWFMEPNLRQLYHRPVVFTSVIPLQQVDSLDRRKLGSKLGRMKEGALEWLFQKSWSITSHCYHLQCFVFSNETCPVWIVWSLICTAGKNSQALVRAVNHRQLKISQMEPPPSLPFPKTSPTQWAGSCILHVAEHDCIVSAATHPTTHLQGCRPKADSRFVQVVVKNILCIFFDTFVNSDICIWKCLFQYNKSVNLDKLLVYIVAILNLDLHMYLRQMPSWYQTANALVRLHGEILILSTHFLYLNPFPRPLATNFSRH